MSDALIAVLKGLSPKEDDNWTGDGLPRLDVLKTLTGSTVTRDEINAAWAGFSRTTNETTSVEVPVKVPSAPAELAKPVKAPEPKVEEPESVTDLDKAKAELEEAQKTADDAGKELGDKTEALDKLIVVDSVVNAVSNADTIKSFQASQNAQRAKTAKNLQLMKAILSENQ